MNISDVQSRAWANKLAKGLSIENVPFEFALAYGELSEAFDAWRKNLDDLSHELADALIYVTCIATMCGIDLDQAVQEKLSINESRIYAMNQHGNLEKKGA